MTLKQRNDVKRKFRKLYKDALTYEQKREVKNELYKLEYSEKSLDQIWEKIVEGRYVKNEGKD